MKNHSNRQYVGWVFALVLLTGSYLVMAHGNEHRESTATLGGGQIKVEYNSPAAKGRDLMSMVAPGVYWRMGADSATTLTSDVDLMFGSTHVAKGTYVLSAHFVSEKKWSLVLSKDRGRRGAAPEEIVAEVPGMLHRIETPVEALTITLDSTGSKAKLTLDWGTSRLSADFEAA